MCGECEWADKSWKILLSVWKSWMPPAFPMNASGKQLSLIDCSLLTWTALSKLNHSKPQRQVGPFHKHIYTHGLWISEDTFWSKIGNLSWERFYSLQPIYYPATQIKRITQSLFTASVIDGILFCVTKIKTIWMSKLWVNYEISKDTRKMTLSARNLMHNF